MADNSVFITGISDGAFADEISKLPPWATEVTAERIAGYLEKSLGIQKQTLAGLRNLAASGGSGSGSGGSLSPADAKKVNDELEKLGKHLKVRNADDAVQARKKKKEAENLDKQNKILGMLSAAGLKVFNTEKKYLDVYDALYTSGINLMNGNNSTKDGFEALNQMVIQTRMDLETLKNIFTKYGQTVNSVGATKFTKALSSAIPKLNDLGYYGEEAGDVIGTMLEAEMGYSDIRGKSTDQIVADSVRFGSQMNRLSKTMGISNAQLQDSMKATAKSNNMMFVAAKFGPEAAKKFNLASAGIMSDAVKEMALQMAAGLPLAEIKGGIDMIRAGFGPEMEQIRQATVRSMSQSVEESIAEFKGLSEQIANSTGKITALSYQTAEVREAGATLVNGMLQQGRATSSATEEELKAAEKTKSTSAKLNQQILASQAIVDAAFFPMIGQVETATAALGWLNDAAFKTIGAIDAGTRSTTGLVVGIAGAAAAMVLAYRTGAGKMGLITSLFKSSGDNIARTTKSTTSALNGLAGSANRAGKGGLSGFASKHAGKLSIGGIVAGAGLDIASEKLEESGHHTAAAAADIASTAAGMAGIGATIGIVVPVLGTLAGGLIGGALGTGIGVYQNWGRISTPTTPSRSTVDSPSSTPPSKAAESTDSSKDAPASAQIDVPDSNAEVNTLLTAQVRIMQQLLESTNSMLSTDKEILRLTRTRA